MTVPKWLIPVLAVVAAVAAGVVGWLVGIRFGDAGDAPGGAAPQIETLPVAGPVDPDAPQTDDDGGIVVSPAIGYADAVVPPATEDAPAGDPALEEIIREMAGSDDPGAGLVEIYHESSEPGASGADGSGDVCAPPEGDAPEDCPSGVYGTVLALTAPEEPFYAEAQYSPGRYVDVPSPHRVYCDPVETESTQALIGVGTNAPALLTVSYHPEGDRSGERSVTAETPEDAAAAWYAGLDANDDFSGIWARPQHCLVIDDLEPGVAYRLVVSAVDELGRTATDTLRFVAGGGRDLPPVRVIPLTDTVLFVSAPHTADQTVEVRVARTFGDDGAAACSASARLLGPYVEVGEHRVSDEYNVAHGFDPAYVARTAGSFVVPEGSRVAVCIRWFAVDAPSWEGDEPLREYTQLLLSPDRLLPRIELADVGLLKLMDAGSVSIRIDDREGRGCGFTVVGPEAGPTSDWDLGPRRMCEPAGDYAARFGGDYVARAEVTYRGETTTGGMMLRLSRDACRGVCEIPEPTEYRMALPTIAATSGLCGSSFGDCDPPTSDTSAGVAVFRVTWTQGNTNGAAEWVQGAPTLGERAVPPPPERPQVDTAHTIEVAETGAGLIATLRLRTDRPVSYTAVLEGCELDGTQTTLFGAIDSSEFQATLDFGPVCHAEYYRATVELVDDAGVTAVWGPGEPDGHWPNSVRTPGLPVDLVGTVHVEPELGDAAAGYLESVIVYVAGEPAFEWAEGRCFGPGGADLPFAASVEASESTIVGVTLVWGPAPAGGPCDAAETHAEYPSTRIPIDDLSSGRTIRIPLDEAIGGSSVLQITATWR